MRKKSEIGAYKPKVSSVKIAIDGPSGAGKSTIAKLVAAKLGYDYIDTGAMYRAIGYKMLKEDVKPEEIERLKLMLDNTEVDFINGKIMLDGDDISDKIRTPEISKAASMCSGIPEVRTKLVEIQRQIGNRKSVVMDGRDIGTNVFKDAEYKFYLDAASTERAKRRFEELKAKGQTVVYEDILKDVEDRDYRDMNRDLNPLRKAEDAILIDSTDMSIDEVVDTMIAEIRN